MIVLMEKNAGKQAASHVALDLAGRGFEVRVKKTHNGDGVVLAALGVVEDELDVLVFGRKPGVKKCQRGNIFYSRHIHDFEDAHDFFSWGY
ncbi:MAG: hypothetical protein A2599_00970 [Candidatus Staskawiczbacteria bacterium RIFOXYD1_FULL_39_28]|uniref:Uncharacterized protein n=1 Tax=Candidatus Staskawiczbacteria bacterium RIFOXYC1_FULL_38_18 TaxID=1802229 RepID=A0A1G2JBZ2_9BACT|nr:MAG: hypothetical protein A2401_00690 [Candidatus Staskawiczbacteria bacterium RIFOXYC1_FULL_38_18]OGZ91407.1 MAG: hypothetical protein A2599_00970 [Candidatus Staskawiczbacteria bacterium RIFOXYD1_FULL_39_28]